VVAKKISVVKSHMTHSAIYGAKLLHCATKLPKLKQFMPSHDHMEQVWDFYMHRNSTPLLGTFAYE